MLRSRMHGYASMTVHTVPPASHNDMSTKYPVRPPVIAVYNNKGGSGKSSNLLGIASGLARYHAKRVLVVDLDGQANASMGLGVPRENLTPSVANLLLTDNPPYHTEIIRPAPSAPGVTLITGHGDMDNADLFLASRVGRERILERRLDPIRDSYDIVMLDCAPNKALMSVNALHYADEFVLPLQPEYFAVDAINGVFEHVRDIAAGLGQVANLLGIVTCRVPPRSGMSDTLRADLRSAYGELLFGTEISATVRIAEAQGLGMPIDAYADTLGADRTGRRAAEQYERLTGEFLDRLRGRGYPV